MELDKNIDGTAKCPVALKKAAACLLEFCFVNRLTREKKKTTTHKKEKTLNTEQEEREYYIIFQIRQDDVRGEGGRERHTHARRSHAQLFTLICGLL